MLNKKNKLSLCPENVNKILSLCPARECMSKRSLCLENVKDYFVIFFHFFFYSLPSAVTEIVPEAPVGVPAYVAGVEKSSVKLREVIN